MFKNFLINFSIFKKAVSKKHIKIVYWLQLSMITSGILEIITITSLFGFISYIVDPKLATNSFFVQTIVSNLSNYGFNVKLSTTFFAGSFLIFFILSNSVMLLNQMLIICATNRTEKSLLISYFQIISAMTIYFM